MTWDWSLDGWIVATAILCAVSGTLLGNFLVLRKMSMMGDAISHAVLPGLAVSFFVTQSRNSVAMFVGAVLVGVCTAVFIEAIKRFGKVDEGASMGVVFTSLFALGLVMTVQVADSVDLDPNCVLYGSLELSAIDTIALGTWEVPRALPGLSLVLVINTLFVAVFYKELKITSFDPATADAMGISSGAMHYSLMILVAVTTVACFESVGSILVVAMLIVPAATAFLLTRRLKWMILLSLLIAVASAISGHWAAVNGPRFFGFGSTTTAGAVATIAGLFFLLAVVALTIRDVLPYAVSMGQLGDAGASHPAESKNRT